MADDRSLKLLQFFREHKDQEFGGADLTRQTGLWAGALYVLLSEFEHEGLITSRWEELPEGQTRPRRRFYRITPQGEAAAYFQSGEGKREWL